MINPHLHEHTPMINTPSAAMNHRVSKHPFTQAFLTMGVFAFAGAWIGALVYFVCWIAERIYTARSLTIALHMGAFLLCGMVAWAVRVLDRTTLDPVKYKQDRLLFAAFWAWTALLMMSTGFWLYVTRR